MDKLMEYEIMLDKELGQFDMLKKLEKRFKVKKTYVAFGGMLVLTLLIVLNYAAAFLVNVIGLVYPMFSSFKALETSGKEDDTKWLTYWVVFGFFSTLDYFGQFILYYVPFYYLFKLVLILYLFLPQFNGSQLIYDKFVRNFFVETNRMKEKVTKDMNEKMNEKKDKKL